MIRMTISDTGIGMNEEQLGRLFEAFSQADASTTKKFGGTGLGLAITRHFCRLLGGDISVDEPGRKRLYLHDSHSVITNRNRRSPNRQVAIELCERIASSKDDSASLTVLVVDDDPLQGIC